MLIKILIKKKFKELSAVFLLQFTVVIKTLDPYPDTDSMNPDPPHWLARQYYSPEEKKMKIVLRMFSRTALQN